MPNSIRSEDTKIHWRRSNIVRRASVVAIGALVALAALAQSAGAVQVYEFGLPAGSKPLYITAGPEGNLWFTDPGTNQIGKISTSGSVTEYGLGLTANAGLAGITAGPDGNVWFTERKGHKIGRITPSGAITEFSTGLTGTPDIYGITSGPGSAVWFTETFAGRIGMINPGTGVIKEFPIPAGTYTTIVQGPDGNLWYPSVNKATISRMTPTGTVSVFGPLPASDCSVGATTPCPYPESIAVGPDGNLWFDEAKGDAIGRITPTGGISEFSNGLTHNAHVADLASGSDGNVWFTENAANQVGRIAPAGVVTEFHDGLSAGAQPFGIAAGPDQNLWVAEPGSGKIARVIPDVPPVVQTGPAGASRAAATVTGTVRSRGAETAYYFQYGPTPAYGRTGSTASNGSGDDVLPVSSKLTRHLSPGREYHYRIVAVNASGTSYGQDATFMTRKPSHKRKRARVTVGPFQMYFSGYSLGHRLRLSKIVVIGVHSGERVSYACEHCHGSPKHRRLRSTKSRASFSGLRLVVGGGSKVRVLVTGVNGSKRVKVYGFRIGAAESKLLGQRCFVAKSHKPVRCPAKAGSKPHHRHTGA